ncbi:hypothetical protein Scep_016825 [Stephania cephalantha]|uniref:Uncharacterized protein n=1 Tax=Stephania cephalantha TaxID=152367 RepID=A0AAP0NT16_9MAGN
MVSRLLEVSVTDADEEIRTRPGLTVSLAWLKDRFLVPKKGKKEPNREIAPDVYPCPDCLGWMYECLPFLKRVLPSDYTSDEPHVMKWNHKKNERLYKKQTMLLLDHLVSFRLHLDKLRSHEVIWNTTLKGAPLVHDIAFYHGPMKFMDIVEPHNPIRVLRQIGYVQRILRDSYGPINTDMSRLAQLYSVKYLYDAQLWEDREAHLNSVERRENPEHAMRVHEEDENSLCNRRALDVALQSDVDDDGDRTERRRSEEHRCSPEMETGQGERDVKKETLTTMEIGQREGEVKNTAELSGMETGQRTRGEEGSGVPKFVGDGIK